MNYGPLIFLAAFFALGSSWLTFVVTPVAQVGGILQTNVLGGTATYPLPRPGLAQQGLDIYRANGCAYCHSQQVAQEGSVFQVMLTDAGTNQSALIAELVGLQKGLSEQAVLELLGGLPKPVLGGIDRRAAERVVQTLIDTSAEASLWVTPVGADLDRGWGKRRSVAEDFMYDYPVMLGAMRVGPDLASTGTRLPDINWHLRHLYAPRAEVKNSIMPPYRYLFEQRPIKRHPSPNALQLSGEFAPPAGYEVVPRPEAVALAAYLVSLRADAPLFSTPMSVASSAGANAGTNAPAPPAGAETSETSTNAPAQ